MRISLALLPAAVLAACGACVNPPQPPRADHVKALESQTVALVVEHTDGSRGAYCAGVWVSPTQVLTADHCMDDRSVGDPVEYVVRDDVRADAADEVTTIRLGAVVARDPVDDLALIAAKAFAPAHGIAILAAPVVGEPVHTMGHPLGLWWSYSAGSVAAVRLASLGEDQPTQWFVQSTAPISPGNSGGGLFDNKGRLVGLCHVKAHHSESISFYIHPDYIAEFLEKAGAR